MAVLSVTLMKKEESESGDDGYKDRDVYHVLTDDPTDGPIVARTATGSPDGPIPDRGDEHEIISGSYVQRVRAVMHEEDPCHFLVTVEYGTTAPTGGAVGGHPWEQPAFVGPIEDHETEQVSKDLDGNAIVNSVGDPFENPLQREVVTDGIQVIQYELDYDLTAMAFYKNRVNQDTFFGFPANQVRLSSVVAEYVPVAGAESAHWRVTYTFKIKLSGWNPRLVNMGRRAQQLNNNGQGYSLQDICSGTGENRHPLPAPSFLDADGYVTPPEEAIEWPLKTSQNPDGTFKLYKSMRFKILPIRWPM